MNQYPILNLCLLICTLFSLSVNAQENNHQASAPIIEAPNEDNLTVADNYLQYEKALQEANIHFKNKHYNTAIDQYTQSLKYLSSNDKTTQKHLGTTYTKIAESYKRIKNRKEAVNFYKKSLDTFTKLDNKKYMARTLNTLAEAERYLGNLVDALDYSTKSLKIHKTINDPKGYAKALMGSGIIYRHIGRYEKSLNHIHKAYLYYKEIEDFSQIAKTSNEMGNIYIKLKEFEQAKYFFQETVNLPEKKIDQNTLASAAREMAVINLNDKNYESAMFFAQKAYKIYQIEKDELKEALITRIIANIYRAQKNNTKAIEYYKRSLSIAIAKNNKIYQIKAQTPLAAMMIPINTNEAINLLMKSLEIAINVKNEGQTLYAYRTLRQAEEHKGDYKQALSYAKKEISLAKTINKKSSNKKLNLTKAALYSSKIDIELKTLRERTKLDQLELTKKNNEIEIVEQAKIINELKLIKNQYTNIALIFLLVTSLLLILLIFRRFVVSKKHNKELYHLASRDHLTNCYNRRALFKLMDSQLTNPESSDEYCIIMADIDYFKNVNDTYGHNKGDSVIKGFAATLKNCVRQNDIVARYGGEEFCIVLHNVSPDKAFEIAECMRKKIEKITFDDISITSSFGVTSLKYGAETASQLIEQADIALYKSKDLGRNQVTLWNKSLNKNVSDNE